MSEVLIVGAGPVGLVMASELARHGIRCRIIDKLTTPSPYCRAIGVTPRTLEVWDDMGIAREAIDAGLWLTGMRVEIEGRETQDLMRDFSDLPFAALGLPQNETERILTQHLRRFGIEIERGVALIAIEQNGEVTSVTLDRGAAGTEQARFRYVIGCDGAHSAVRKLAGIAFEGQAMPYDFMLGDVHIDWDLPRGLTFRAMRPVKDSIPDLFIAIPLPEPNRYRVTMLAPADLSASGTGTEHGIQSERPAPGLAPLQAGADRIVASRPRLSDIRWSSLFRISMRLAQSYRKENLFLAGDAAHIHPPTGGQGMNTGIQDAYNLAWKMALVLKSAAPTSLLDSYDVERRAEGADVLARTIAASRQLAGGNTKQDRLADTQILVSYQPSAWIQDAPNGNFAPAAPAPGQRAPDCQGLHRQGVGFPLRLFDILRGTEHVLLVDTANVSSLNDLTQSLRQEFGNAFSSYLRIVAIGEDITSPRRGIVSLHDPEKNFRTTYQTQEGNAYLIRPDGMIAWRGADTSSLFAYLRNIFTA